MSDGPRMLYRTRHILILLSGLINLVIGSYFTYRPQLGQRLLQMLGSALIVIGTVLFIVAFFYEPGLSGLYTPRSHDAMYMIAIGTLLHLFSEISSRPTGRSK